jgi:hypothetical protein
MPDTIIKPKIETHEPRMLRPDPDPTIATQELVRTSTTSLKDYFVSKLDSVEKAQITFHDDLVRVPTALDKGLATARDYADSQMSRVIEHADANFAINGAKFIAEEEHRRISIDRINDQLASIINIITANKVEADNYREIIAEQTRKNSTDVDAAVKAAFAASTLAVTQQNIANALASDKQGAAFTKDIEKLTVSLAQIQKSSDDKLEEVRKNNDQRLNDIKDRIGQMEGRSGERDPATSQALRDMYNSINQLSRSSNMNEGKSLQVDTSKNVFLAAAAIIVTFVIGFAGIAVALLSHHS